MSVPRFIVISAVCMVVSCAPTVSHASPDVPMCVTDRISLSEVPLRSENTWGISMCGPYAAPIALAEPSPLSKRAIEAYKAATDRIGEARYEEARLQLDLAGQGLPRIRDRIAVQKARLELLRGRPGQAAAFFAEAAESIHESVRVEARVGHVLSLLRAGDPGADAALHDLVWAYPALPRAELLFEQAEAHLRARRHEEAAGAFHAVRVDYPGSHLAPRAELELSKLAAREHAVPTLSDDERVKIARQLVRTGPLDRAKTTVTDLLNRPLTPEQGSTVNYLAGRIARYEGRWSEAETYLRTAHRLSVPDELISKEIADRAADMAATAAARQKEAAFASMQRLRGGRALEATPSTKLRDMVAIASAAGLQEEVDDILVVLSGRASVPASILFDSTVAAVGTGGEGLIVVLLERIAKKSRRYQPAAFYHLARAHERAGRDVAAEALYAQVIEAGDPYYSLWAVNGLERLQGGPRIESPEGFSELDRRGIPRAPQPEARELAERLEPLSKEHEAAYPWIGRAEDLLRIEERDAATAELFEAYLSWRDAVGKPVARAGLDSVVRADGRAQEAVEADTRLARAELSDAHRAVLAEVSSALGDEGTAGGFAGVDYIESLPRAYEWLAVPAASRYGLDPNLLLAVMRVESAYQKHIVSYAGAVGLMQIMPRTGQLIAHAVDHHDYAPADLLDPKTNLEFAAWYLTSLIRRFDGRLPLALAAYNGGPHNVRRWIQETSDGATVDILLERIPFTQTHRYVRKVLVKYEAYRKQQGLTAPRLSTKLPGARVDRLSF